MFFLKKLITPFLLPPGIFVVGLLLSALWFLMKKNWKAGFVNMGIGCLMWAISVSPVSDRMLRGLESEQAVPQNVTGDVIILLGGGVYSRAPDLTGLGIPSDHAMGRLVTAARLHKRLGIPVIVCGGQVFENTSAEAPILRRFLIDLGVPTSDILMDQNSKDTFENAKYSQQLVKRYGFGKPLLVTSGYHMRRSVLAFKKMGLEVTPVPSGTKTWRGRIYGWQNYLPRDFRDVSVAVKEYLGILFYRLFYPAAA
jgi:uncharacterized SAM-binding protein YcdF (DUF218 family)